MKYVWQFGILGAVAGVIVDIVGRLGSEKKPLTEKTTGLEDEEKQPMEGNQPTKQGDNENGQQHHQGGISGDRCTSRSDLCHADDSEVTTDQGQGDPAPDQTQIDNQEFE